MGFISVKQYTPKLQLLSMFFAGKKHTKKEVLQFKRKGLGNKEFSNWNPQSEFTSDEEKEQVSRLLPLELALFTSVLSSKA